MYVKLSQYNFVKSKPDRPFVSIYSNSKRNDIEINKSAEEILSMCNGELELTDIIDFLSNKYQNSRDVIARFVKEILSPFYQIAAIEEREEQTNDKVCKGSDEIGLPDTLIWEITEFCPLNCQHCYLGEKGRYHIAVDEIDQIVNLVDHCGITIVQLTGGEPLTHPNFDYIMDKLIEKRVVVTIATSGVILNDSVLNSLRKLKYVGGIVQVSIDGTEDYHNSIRGNVAAYQKSIRFIETLVKERIPVSVSTCLVDQDENMIKELTKRLKNLGVSLLTISLILQEGNAKKYGLKSKYTHTRIKKLIAELNDKYSTNTFRIREYGEKTERNCGAGYNVIRLKSNLDVTPCPMIDIKLGNLSEENIESICRRSHDLFYSLNSPDEDQCSDCSEHDTCGRCTACGFNKKSYTTCKWYEHQKEEIDMIFDL